MMRSLAILAVALSGCAAPGYQMSIPAQVAVALAGGDPAQVDANGPPMTVKAWWYDRDVTLRITQEGRSVDLHTVSDAEAALKAHQVDAETLKGLAGLLSLLSPAVP